MLITISGILYSSNIWKSERSIIRRSIEEQAFFITGFLYYNQTTIRLQLDYNQITIGLPLGYSQLLHLLHLDSIKHKQSQNKERNVKAEDEGERGKEVTKKKDRKEECDRQKRKERGKKDGDREEKQKEEEADEKAGEEERRERRKEERRGRKEEEEDKEKNRECGTKDAPPPQDAFPSRRLGNNMTPIKGRLGKNTAPTHGDPEKLIQRRQRNPSEDSRTSSIHPVRTSSTHYEKQNLQKRRAQKQQNPHL